MVWSCEQLRIWLQSFGCQFSLLIRWQWPLKMSSLVKTARLKLAPWRDGELGLARYLEDLKGVSHRCDRDFVV